MRRPKPLSTGSRVQVIAPSSPFDPEHLAEGLRILDAMGLIPVVADRVFEKDDFLAGTDAARGAELVAALTAPDGQAVFPVRGGYGAERLLPLLDAHADHIVPTLWMGFSDFTALHLFLLNQGCLTSLHGPNVVSIGRLDAPSREHLEAAIFGRDWERTFFYDGLTPLQGGCAEGPLTAGNLAVIASLFGTPYAPCLDGRILVLEDVHEPVYRIDRMLTQLTMQPGFDRIAGVAFGDLSVPHELMGSLQATLIRFAARLGRPVVTGFPMGHGICNWPVPEGVNAVLDAEHGFLQVVQDPFERG